MPFDPAIRAQVQAFSVKEGVANSMAEAQRQEGVFQGQTVKTVDANSKLADAAEEMSFAASEKVEKKLSERKSGSKEALRASATELAEKYVNMMAEPQAGRKLHEFLEALKGQGEQVSESDIRQMAKEAFGDVADQHAALSFAEEALLKEGKQDALVAKIKSVKNILMREAGPAIRSGLNIAAEVLNYSRQGLERADALRDLYRFAVLGGHNIASVYQAIMSRYGASQFTSSLEFLLKAVGSDLEGRVMGPSIDAAQLKTTIDDIYHVQALGNLHRSLSDLLDQTRRLYPA